MTAVVLPVPGGPAAQEEAATSSRGVLGCCERRQAARWGAGTCKRRPSVPPPPSSPARLPARRPRGRPTVDERHILSCKGQRHRALLALVQAPIQRLPGRSRAVKARQTTAKEDVHKRCSQPALPLAAQALRRGGPRGQQPGGPAERLRARGWAAGRGQGRGRPAWQQGPTSLCLHQWRVNAAVGGTVCACALTASAARSRR